MASEIDAIVDDWRRERATGSAENNQPVRFVVESSESAKSIRAQSEELLGLSVAIEPLFADNEELARFHLLIVPGVSRPDRADLFEIAGALRQRTGAATVEPDLGTDFFQPETRAPEAGAPESADWTFWCWAKQLPKESNWAILKTRVPEAWQRSSALNRPSRGEGILIFQPDTGVVSAHVELPPNIATDQRAANFVEPGKSAEDPLIGDGNPGHGTGTGSVVASPEPGQMTGSAPLATLVPIRCIKTVAVFDQSLVAQAIDHARRQGAQVITMSLGGVLSSALHAAVQKAVSENVIVLAAAGNCVGEVVWPARYQEVIAVAGVNESFAPWRGSCRGPAVDISAPAEFVLRADGQDKANPPTAVSGGQGTSFAVAITAGIAALWLAHHGRDSLLAMLPFGGTLQAMFRGLLQRSAQVPDNFDKENFGAGIVDALGLLEQNPQSAGQVEFSHAQAPVDDQSDLRALVAQAFGSSGAEAVAPVLGDRQQFAELACAALDRIRANQTTRAKVESLPSPMLSPSLRSRLTHALDA